MADSAISQQKQMIKLFDNELQVWKNLILAMYEFHLTSYLHFQQCMAYALELLTVKWRHFDSNMSAWLLLASIISAKTYGVCHVQPIFQWHCTQDLNTFSETNNYSQVTWFRNKFQILLNIVWSCSDIIFTTYRMIVFVPLFGEVKITTEFKWICMLGETLNTVNAVEDLCVRKSAFT